MAGREGRPGIAEWLCINPRAQVGHVPNRFLQMENALKVPKRIRRIRGKYLSAYEEYLGMFAVHKVDGKYLNVFREDPKRLLAYSVFS